MTELSLIHLSGKPQDYHRRIFQRMDSLGDIFRWGTQMALKSDQRQAGAAPVKFLPESKTLNSAVMPNTHSVQ